MFFDAFDLLLLVVDELVDGGIIMETDPTILAKAADTSSSKGDGSVINEQSMAKAMTSAGSFLKRTILS